MTKIIKRTVSCAICILIMGCLAIPIFAESNFIVSGNTVTAKNGEAVVVISLKNNPGFASMNLFFTYDDKYLTLNRSGVINLVSDLDMSYATGGMWETRDNDPSSSSNYSKDGVLCELHFKVADNTPVGEYEVGVFVEASGYNDIDYTAYSIDAKSVSAIIKVTCPHTNKTSVAEVPATCAAEGTKAHEKCSDCGKLFLNGKEVTEAEISTPKDPTNHNGKTEIRNAEPATEEKEGYTGDTYCLGCNQKIKDGIIIPPLDHTHSMTHTAPIAPDCTNNGVLEHWTCSKCGKIYDDEAGTAELKSTVDPKLGHKTEVKGAKEANCTEAGYTGDEVCTVCNETIANGEVIPPKGHTIETVDAKDATCGEYGYTGDKVCTVCKETITKGEPIPPTEDHKNTEVRDAKDADCIHEGYTGDTYCLDCEAKIETGTIIKPTGIHDFEWVTVKEAKFNEAGLERQVCKVCQEVGEEREIPPLDCFHSAMEHHEKVAATCINTGTVEYWRCTECNRNYSDEKGTREITDTVLPIDPTNHVHTEIRNASPATCVSTGNSGDTYCTDCGTLVTAGNVTSVDPNAHHYINNVCTYCGHVRIVYRPTTYMYIDDYSHLASGIKERHVPDSMTKHTDGEYEWSYCLYCQHEYGKVPVVNVSVDDTVDIVVDDPVQSGDDETIPDVPVTEPQVNEPVQDTNPPTGIAIALLPLVLAAGAVALIKRK